MPMSQQAAMMMQPFMIPMVGFYCAPSAFGNSMHETQTAGMSPQKAPEQEHEIPEETGEKPHSESDEEVYYHLVESYNHPGQWRWVEEGLFIRATPLTTIESCYVEKTNCDYLLWGSLKDCEAIAEKFSRSIVHLDIATMEARTISSTKTSASSAHHGLKVALREIRTYPLLVGFVCFDDGRRCLLETVRKPPTKQDEKPRFEDELLLAIVCGKAPHVQITFW